MNIEKYLPAIISFVIGLALLFLFKKMKHPQLGLVAFGWFGTVTLCLLAMSIFTPN